MRLISDHRISIRNTAEYHRANLLSEDKLTERQMIHRAAMDKRFPQLADIPFECAWSGVEGISRTGTNFFGEQSRNIYFAGGYNGSGLSRGTTFGTAVAEYASNESSPIISDCLNSVKASGFHQGLFLILALFYGSLTV